jgi:hypothetical protein
MMICAVQDVIKESGKIDAGKISRIWAINTPRLARILAIVKSTPALTPRSKRAIRTTITYAAPLCHNASEKEIVAVTTIPSRWQEHIGVSYYQSKKVITR